MRDQRSELEARMYALLTTIEFPRSGDDQKQQRAKLRDLMEDYLDLHERAQTQTVPSAPPGKLTEAH